MIFLRYGSAPYFPSRYCLSNFASFRTDSPLSFLNSFNDELAGYLKLNIGSVQTESDYPEALEIQRIYVLQKYQGQKMGLSMMQHAIAVAKKIKKSQVWLGVWEKNLKAQAFYRKSGFEKVGSHDFVLGDDIQTDYILMKEL